MLYLKALHIIGVVVWFAGLFYLGRLFVYHQEAQSKPEPECSILSAQFALMERRLWYVITWPGLCITVIFGSVLLHFWGFPDWLYAKLGLVALLIGYHLWCGRLRAQLAEGTCTWNSRRFRLFNEVPSLLLIAIVFVVVLKDAVSWPWLLLVLAGIGGIIGITVWVVAARKQANSGT